MASKKILLYERIGLQCVTRRHCVNVAARVLGKLMQDEVQRRVILVAPKLLNGPGIVPGPTIKVVERDNASKEAGKMSAQVWK